MNEEDKLVHDRINKILPRPKDKILLIETLLGCGYALTDFIRKNHDFITPDAQTAYHIGIVIANLFAFVNPIHLDGKAIFEIKDFSKEEDLDKKLAFTVKHLYDYCKERKLLE